MMKNCNPVITKELFLPSHNSNVCLQLMDNQILIVKFHSHSHLISSLSAKANKSSTKKRLGGDVFRPSVRSFLSE